MGNDHNGTRSNLRSLGPEEARLFLDVVSRSSSSVTTQQAAALLGSEARARGTIKRLVAKGWLQAVGGGRYVVLPPAWGAEKSQDFDLYVLASASVDVGYVGWWAAASRHGMTTQVPSEMAVATDRQIAPRILQGNHVRYVKLAPRKLFGWEEMDSMGRTFRISNPEKTMVDCVDRPELCGGLSELALIVANGARKVDDQKLVQTAIRHGTVSVGQRLGYLLDLCAPDFLTQAARRELHNMIPPSARSILGPSQRREDAVGYDQEWGLLVHVTEAELLAEVGNYSWGIRP